MTPEIVITVGFPGSGKSTVVKALVAQGYQVFNRDTLGGKLVGTESLTYTKAREAFHNGCHHIVFDNTYGTVESRMPVFSLAKELGLPVRCMWLQVPLEQAQVFAARRQIQRLGKLLRPSEYKAAGKADPNMFPPAAQYAYSSKFQEPTVAEGFSSVEKVEIKTVWGPEYVNKALILDLDGTLRTTPDEKACPYPRTVDEVILLPNRRELLLSKQRGGFLLLGATNQSGIDRDPKDAKHVSEENVIACIKRTNDLLNLDTPIDVLYSTDRGGPPQSYWRKPCPGMGVALIEKYKLNPADCIYVGDATSDKTFATRCGFQFAWVHEFFA